MEQRARPRLVRVVVCRYPVCPQLARWALAVQAFSQRRRHARTMAVLQHHRRFQRALGFGFFAAIVHSLSCCYFSFAAAKKNPTRNTMDESSDVPNPLGSSMQSAAAPPPTVPRPNPTQIAASSVTRRLMTENSRLHSSMTQNNQYVMTLEETLHAITGAPLQVIRYNFRMGRGLLEPVRFEHPPPNQQQQQQQQQQQHETASTQLSSSSPTSAAAGSTSEESAPSAEGPTDPPQKSKKGRGKARKSRAASPAS